MKRLAHLAWGAGLAAGLAAAIPEAPPATGAAAVPEAAPAAASATAAFDPYRVIIDRAIFGRPPVRPAPPVPAPDLAAQKQAEALAKKITMCAVNRTPSGNTAVGFIDNDAKPPRNIYLNVGDTADGYTILAADYDAETATIEKEGVVITLQLGKGLVGTGLPAAAAAAAPAAAAPEPDKPVPGVVDPALPTRLDETTRIAEAKAAEERALNPNSVATLPTRTEDGKLLPTLPGVINRMLDSGKITDASYRAKLEKRRTELLRIQEAQQLKEELTAMYLAKKIAAEEVALRLRHHNLNLIRQGENPVDPIILSPEEDEQLVKEGVLEAP